MKFYKLMMFSLMLATAVMTVGCGGSDEEGPKPGEPGYVGPAAAAVIPPAVNSGYSPYCGAGQVFNGVSCVAYTGQPIGCSNNYVWNTQYNSCIPNNFNGSCPAGNMQWNGTGCAGTGQSVPSYGGGWQCYSVQYSPSTGLYYYTCQYVQYAPRTSCVWTMYGPYCY